MEEFVKKFSDVPNGFVEDFFDIAKDEYSDNDFAIDFDIVIKWLNTRKDSLKRLLTNFTEGYDFTMEKIKIILCTTNMMARVTIIKMATIMKE